MEPKEDQSLNEELIASMKEWVSSFLNWLKPNPNDLLLLKILKLVLKIPVLLFVILLSPILLIVLGIAFAAVL